MRSRIALAALSLGAVTLAALLLSGSAPPAPGRVAEAAATIGVDALRAHVVFLADDLLEGRATGTRGYDLAARYVAAEFAALGLEPAGTDGYLQPIRFRRAELDRERSRLTFVREGRETALELGRDFVMSGDALREASEIDAPLVFAGFGVTAPEFGHDDYRGIDARGKIVVLLRGAPPRFPHNERAFYSWGRTKSANAVGHGAVGTITIRTRHDERNAPWSRVVRQSTLPRFEWLERDGTPHGVFPALRGSATLSREAAEALFAGAPEPLDTVLSRGERSRSRSFPLGARARLVTRTRLAPASSPNVVARLRGSDPRLAAEHVVLTAHLDHLGVTAPVDGDSIHNGAIDNASGIAAMIEVARALRTLPRAPRRSILFIATTAEEKGLLGAEYFAARPTVPMASIVANLNLDMFVMQFPVADLVAYGAEHSSLGAVAEAAARAAGFALSPDPHPEEVVFIRSDQFPFVRQGVPALFLTAGDSSRTAGVDGPRLQQEWRRQRYHQPGDDLDQPIDWDSGVRFARANFHAVWEIAEADARPTWNRGDFFGRKFGRGRTARR